jgi:DNA-binding transcriptional LysR family regulator
LRIHAASLHLKHLLPPWLRRLQAQRPDIEVELQEIRSPDPAVLRSGEADLLVDHLSQAPRDLEIREIGRMNSFLVLPAHHPFAKRRRVRLEDLGEGTFIAYSSGMGGRELQLRALELSGAKPRRIYAADSADAILGFVAAGIGYSLVPSLAEHGPRMAGVVPNPLVEAALALAPGS